MITNKDECICEFQGDTVGSAIWVKKCLTHQYQIDLIIDSYEVKIKKLQQKIYTLENDISYYKEDRYREWDKNQSNHEMGR